MTSYVISPDLSFALKFIDDPAPAELVERVARAVGDRRVSGVSSDDGNFVVINWGRLACVEVTRTPPDPDADVWLVGLDRILG